MKNTQAEEAMFVAIASTLSREMRDTCASGSAKLGRLDRRP